MKYENEIFKMLCTLSLMSENLYFPILFINKAKAQTWTSFRYERYIQYDLANYTTTPTIKATLVDISAHWCGPCWSWHTGGVMEEIVP